MLNYIFNDCTYEDAEGRAAQLITKAMIRTNSCVEVFRGDELTRVDPMQLLFKKNLLLVKEKSPQSMHYHYSEENNNASDLDCFFMLVPSAASHSTLFEKIVYGGVIEFVLRYGVNILLRLMKTSDLFDATEAELMQGREYYSLQRMVVSPSKQGTGLGSRHLGRQLKEMDRLKMPVILSTQELRNVVFYTRL